MLPWTYTTYRTGIGLRRPISYNGGGGYQEIKGNIPLPRGDLLINPTPPHPHRMHKISFVALLGSLSLLFPSSKLDTPRLAPYQAPKASFTISTDFIIEFSHEVDEGRLCCGSFSWVSFLR